MSDRVLIRTSADEYPATVAAVDALTTEMPMYLIAPDPGATFPRNIDGLSHLRPLDDADAPLVVTG